MFDVVVFGIFGVVYAVFGLALLIKWEAVSALILGLFGRPVGIVCTVIVSMSVSVLLTGYYDWGGWTTILNIIGWILLVKSSILLFRPAWIYNMLIALFLNRRLCTISACVALAFASFMLYLSFFVL